MRPALALLLSVIILLGVHSYLRFADSLRRRVVSQPAVVAAAGEYTADITLTFPAEADSFALDSTSLLLKQQNEVLLKREGLVPAGEPLKIERLPNIVVGENEFYFSCVPQPGTEHQALAVRIRLFHDGVLVAERTFWSEPGLPPQGTITLTVPAAAAHKHDDHT